MDLEFGACLDRVTGGLPGDHIPRSTNVNLVPYITWPISVCCVASCSNFIILGTSLQQTQTSLETRPVMSLGNLIARLLSLASFILTLIFIFAGAQCGGALGDVYIVLVSNIDVSRYCYKDHACC